MLQYSSFSLPYGQTPLFNGPKNLAVQDAQTWASIWAQLGNAGPPPDIDFSRLAIAIAVQGMVPNSCGTTVIRNAGIDSQGRILVSYAYVLVRGPCFQMFFPSLAAVLVDNPQQQRAIVFEKVD